METRWLEFPFPANWGIRLRFLDESAQPSGSIKHRYVRALFLHALASGWLTPDTPVVMATSGNAAAAGAYFANLIGVEFTTVLPAKTGADKVALIEHFGGRCRFAEPPSAIYAEARRLADQLGGWYLDHFVHVDRGDWHGANDLATELVNPCDPPRWVVLGAGTGASSASVGRYLRYRGLPGQLAVVDPEHSAYFPGWVMDTDAYATGMPSRIEGIGRPRIEPGFLRGAVDLVIPVPDAASIAAMRTFRERTGHLVGASTGTNLWGACQLAATMLLEGTGGTIHSVVADGGERYRHTCYDEGWVAERGLELAPRLMVLDHFLRTGTWPRSDA